MICTGKQQPWTAPDGAQFVFTHWLAETETLRGLIVAVHGLSGAALDFEPLGRRMTRHGFITYAVELRGQGSDPLPARRGDLKSIDDWFADLRAFISRVETAHPGVPLFLYGESMGAAILTRYLAREPSTSATGLILASPVVVLPHEPPAWQQLIFRALLFACPRLRINVRKITKPRKGAPPAWVTRDAAHREWFETAPHRVDSFTLRFFNCLHDLISGCHAAAPRLSLPVLILYAGRDIFIRSERVEAFCALLGSRAREMEFYPEAYHLLLHDDDREQVLTRVSGWLEKRLT